MFIFMFIPNFLLMKCDQGDIKMESLNFSERWQTSPPEQGIIIHTWRHKIQRKNLKFWRREKQTNACVYAEFLTLLY
jgi:hypothetical protein